MARCGKAQGATSARVAQHTCFTDLGFRIFSLSRYWFFLWPRRGKTGGELMLVGVPREIKDSEYRVGLVPSTVRELALKGHRVLVQKDAGLGAGLADDVYVAAGAEIAAGADR